MWCRHFLFQLCQYVFHGVLPLPVCQNPKLLWFHLNDCKSIPLAYRVQLDEQNKMKGHINDRSSLFTRFSLIAQYKNYSSFSSSFKPAPIINITQHNPTTITVAKLDLDNTESQCIRAFCLGEAADFKKWNKL